MLHWASPASPIDYLELPIQTLKVGALGTHKALGLAKAKGARFVLASTSEVYGDPLEHPQRETYWGNVNPIGPRGVYDEAKRFAEAMTMAYHRYHGVDAKIVRIFNTYGPRMRLNDGRAVPAFIGQALRGEDVTVFGDGAQTRSFCYVSDLVDGIIRLMLSDANDPVNIGNPHEMTIEEIARTIIRMTGSSSRIVYTPLPTDDPKVRQPDITRARTLLDWEPEGGPRGRARTRRSSTSETKTGGSLIDAARVDHVVEARDERDHQAHPTPDVHDDRRLLQVVEEHHDDDGDDVEWPWRSCRRWTAGTSGGRRVRLTIATVSDNHDVPADDEHVSQTGRRLTRPMPGSVSTTKVSPAAACRPSGRATRRGSSGWSSIARSGRRARR